MAFATRIAATGLFAFVLFFVVLELSNSLEIQRRCSVANYAVIRDNFLDCEQVATGGLDKPRDIVLKYCTPSMEEAAKNASERYFECFAKRGLPEEEWLKELKVACDY